MNDVDIHGFHNGETDIRGLKFYNIYYQKQFTGMENEGFKEKEALVDDIIEKNHIHLVSFWISKNTPLDNIFGLMQGECWSPDGEARDLIRLLGLSHTSMSVGDLIEDAREGIIYEVARFGFNKI